MRKAGISNVIPRTLKCQVGSFEIVDFRLTIADLERLISCIPLPFSRKERKDLKTQRLRQHFFAAFAHLA